MRPQLERRTFRGWPVMLVAIAGATASAAERNDSPRPHGRAPTTQRVAAPQVGFEIEMVRLPSGEITVQGADGKPVRHAVKPIWIGKYEVTWAEYNPFWQETDLPREQRNGGGGRRQSDAESRPSRPYFLPHYKGEQYPACGASYLSAKNYCHWLSKMTGKKFRLPTEAEWEYACRAGEPAGGLPKDEKVLAETAWYERNAGEEPHEVGTRRPNGWGLHDMLGNLAEWVIRDPAANVAVVAGGSMYDKADKVSPSARDAYSPKWQRDDPAEPKSRWWMCNGFHVGFRVVMEE